MLNKFVIFRRGCFLRKIDILEQADRVKEPSRGEKTRLPASLPPCLPPFGRSNDRHRNLALAAMVRLELLNSGAKRAKRACS